MFIKSALLFAVLMLGVSTSAWATDGDAGRGHDLYKSRCSACHKLDYNLVGPQLNGVWGRKAGSVAGFAYSDGLKNSGLVWDAVTLDKWLTAPSGLVSGPHMTMRTADAGERADLIAYLKTLKSNE